MSTTLTNILCCAGNCVCYSINNCLSSGSYANPKIFVRIGYMVISIVGVLSAIFMLEVATTILFPFKDFLSCPEDPGLRCLGISSIYRFSLSLALLHLIMLVLSSVSNSCSRVLNYECWSFKVLVLYSLYASFLFVSNNFFKYIWHKLRN